jgi:hypothetical protein
MQYSGLYRIYEVKNILSGGQFTQILTGQRYPQQESKIDSTPDQTFNTSTGIAGMIKDFTHLWDF